MSIRNHLSICEDFKSIPDDPKAGGGREQEWPVHMG